MRWPDLVFIKELIVKSGMKWNDLVPDKPKPAIAGTRRD